ncbi:hypothetical protein BABINDRAFT_8462 [Babjeviella inositovora NRRL Y-12698]|uniref:Enoyl-CoA hydratase n=1 Tax=Babjeviella inositovora NRRL Y-12698 TaxID=984486 RepID=A0A1E3QPH8_9ASCO|nr:uncharacterized protein BABINDRAFT_8462 [Babjeviella inositovora NRRL Y-12698]ODQ79548.1 hypothetical protein BABINDRAFT_8462 [Babjeviella inositovora NRRL Y-12698]
MLEVSNPHSYQYIRASTRLERVRLVELHRPAVLNALSPAVLLEICHALQAADSNPEIRCIILAGSPELKVFAAGADIKYMLTLSSEDVLNQKGMHLGTWDKIYRTLKPMVAAVQGLALGGGCELAMCCDIILATKKTRFGQPEIKLGIIPGGGGTQRFTQIMGKSRAMELVLTGDMFGAVEANNRGLVAKLYDDYEDLMKGALYLAYRISGMSPIAIANTKRSVNESFELGLTSGLKTEQAFLIQGLLNSRLGEGDDEEEDE